jgi:hypothetical protein
MDSKPPPLSPFALKKLLMELVVGKWLRDLGVSSIISLAPRGVKAPVKSVFIGVHPWFRSLAAAPPPCALCG